MGVKTIGIIGGGQLGLMIAEQAARLGARTISLDPAPDAPAFRVCDEHIVAAYDDAAALEELCRRSDVVTYEFENVPGEVIVPLMERYNIPQGYKPLYDSQDRVREKSNARDNGLQTPRFAEVIDRESLLRGLFEIGYPCVFKTRTLGYDGHGQVVLRRPEDIAKTEPYWGTPAILEEFVPFDYEASIVMVSDGERIVSFPIGQNIHREGILDLCLVPAPKMSDEVRGRLVRQSEAFMRRCGYKGILAIEYFIRGEEIYFNEMAPRPHNSGHYTIEGCTTNQFPRTVPLPARAAARRAEAGGPHGDEEHSRRGSRGGRSDRPGDRPRDRQQPVQTGAGRLRSHLRQDGEQAQTQDGAHHLCGHDAGAV